MTTFMDYSYRLRYRAVMTGSYPVDDRGRAWSSFNPPTAPRRDFSRGPARTNGTRKSTALGQPFFVHGLV
jgi:hypothetical protein